MLKNNKSKLKSSIPRLIVLSDLWGMPKEEWFNIYLEKLIHHFDIKVYDSCQLGKVNTDDFTQENLHQQFVNGGISTAAERLLQLEKEKTNILAFSVGGVIAWKANLLGMNVESFFAVSSTRLRKETKMPDSNIKLYFGDQDSYQPSVSWYEDLKLEHQIFKGAEHGLYKDSYYIDLICSDLLKSRS